MLRKEKPFSTLVEIFAAFLIMLLLYTGLTKLFDHTAFRYQLSISPWSLLASTSGFISWALPIGEILIAIMLIIKKYRLMGFILNAIMFIAFIAYLVILLNSGSKLPCTCGGIISTMSWTTHVYFNIGCLILSVAGAWLQKSLNTLTIGAVSNNRRFSF